MKPFTPQDWYWIADNGQVFASARQAVVTTSDAGYEAAQAAGGVTRWPVDNTGAQTNASLQAVLAPYGLYITLAAQLTAYAQEKASTLKYGGILVNIAASGQPAQNVECATDAASLLELQIANGIATANPSVSQPFPFPSGVITLTAAQIEIIYQAVVAFWQSVTIQQSAIAEAIKTGTITITSQIDDPPAPLPAWPVNS